MHLREGEEILKIYHHHPTPFIFDVVKVIAGFFPFYLGLFAAQNALSLKWYIILHLIIFFLFVLVVTYISLIYWLDRLIVTNLRVLYIDYKYLTVRDDSSILLDEITDIQTHEKGLLSYFWVFDYGVFAMDTASSYVALTFTEAPNPEGIRRFIYKVKNITNDRKRNGQNRGDNNV